MEWQRKSCANDLFFELFLLNKTPNMQKFKGNNDKLLRWSLGLQPYRFRICHVAGADNIGADLLSRSDQ